MPPKPKFSREEIVGAALDIVSREGISALTARELGERLGSSPRPIFTVFKSMDEVMQAVRDEAMRRYDAYVARAKDYFPSFKAIGIFMLRFAKEQPKLFNLLFMQENSQARRFDDIFATLGDTARLSIDFVMSDYGLTEEEAHFLFQYVWTFTYGLSVQSATGMCDFSEEELVSMLGNEFMSIMGFMKSGIRNNVITTLRPVRRDDPKRNSIHTKNRIRSKKQWKRL